MYQKVQIVHIYKKNFSSNADHDIADFKFHEILRNKAACLKGGT